MREIDQMLKQWLPVNTIIREQFREIITNYIELKMIETFDDARRIYERNPDSGKIRSRELMDYGNEQMVNPAVNSVPIINNNSILDDGVCEGEYVRTTHPTQEEIINFNKKENTRKEVAEDDTCIKTIYYYIDLLEKLKDFDYWKEWKHK